MVFSRHPTLRILFILTLGVLLNGCTNSKLIIGPLYNQLDDQMLEQFNKLGDFTDSQRSAFDTWVGTYHVWHRQSEMPQYASVIQDIATSIAVPGDTSPEDVQRWMQSAEQFSRSARDCHPVNFSFDLMKSLSDEQIDSIEARFKRERTKNRDKYKSRTTEQRIERRLNSIAKWAGRMGLTLNASQRSLLRSSLTKQTSLRNEYYQLSDRWNRELFALARNRESNDFNTDLRAHLSEFWTLLETSYPKQWHKNRLLWQDTAYQLILSMSAEQRDSSSAWLRKMSETVRAISEDKPSFKVGNDPSAGCLVDDTKS